MKEKELKWKIDVPVESNFNERNINGFGDEEDELI